MWASHCLAAAGCSDNGLNHPCRYWSVRESPYFSHSKASKRTREMLMMWRAIAMPELQSRYAAGNSKNYIMHTVLAFFYTYNSRSKVPILSSLPPFLWSFFLSPVERIIHRYIFFFLCCLGRMRVDGKTPFRECWIIVFLLFVFRSSMFVAKNEIAFGYPNESFSFL